MYRLQLANGASFPYYVQLHLFPLQPSITHCRLAMSVLMLVRIELIRFHPARCAIDTLAYDPVTSVSQRAPLGGGVDLHIRWIISRCNFHFSPLPYPFFFLSPLKQPRETIFVYGSLVSRSLTYCTRRVLASTGKSIGLFMSLVTCTLSSNVMQLFYLKPVLIWSLSFASPFGIAGFISFEYTYNRHVVIRQFKGYWKISFPAGEGYQVFAQVELICYLTAGRLNTKHSRAHCRVKWTDRSLATYLLETTSIMCIK